MLGNITLGQYYPGTSFIHVLDPRTKIIIVLLMMTSIFFTERVEAYLLVTGFLALTIYISHIPVQLVLQAVRPMWIIIAFTMAIHFLSTPGSVVVAWGVLTVTAEGIRQGIAMAFRLVLLIVSSSMLTFTTSPIRLTDGIEYLLKPFKRFGLPAHELALMMTIALRFIPTLLEETDRIMKAQIARGADLSSGNLFVRAKNMVPILVPLFVSAFRRADELAIAMEARCYRGGINRTRMKELKMSTSDLQALLATVIMVAILIILWVGLV